MRSRFLFKIFILLITTAIQLRAQDYKTAMEAVGLETGTLAPTFEALDADSNKYSLQIALEKGPVVVIFYRGEWCPVCNRHLSKIQDSLDFIYERGASVVAISPQKPEYLKKARKKIGSEFTLLYDEGFLISDSFDVTFLPEQKTTMKYNTFLGAKLKESQSDDSLRLPIPATYIINKDRKIIWRQFDPDYKNRSMVSEILIALDGNTSN